MAARAILMAGRVISETEANIPLQTPIPRPGVIYRWRYTYCHKKIIPPPPPQFCMRSVNGVVSSLFYTHEQHNSPVLRGCYSVSACSPHCLIVADSIIKVLDCPFRCIPGIAVPVLSCRLRYSCCQSIRTCFGVWLTLAQKLKKKPSF